MNQPADSTKLIVTLLLWFFLGSLGAHRLYLGDIAGGIIILGLTAVGIATACIGIGFIVLFGLSVWLIIDLILILTGSLKPKDGSRLI